MILYLIATFPGCQRGIHVPFSRALSLRNRVRRERYYERIKEAGFDCVVIDIKTIEGYIGIPFDHPLLRRTRAVKGDLRKVADYFRGRGIYVVGRVTLFKDRTLRRVLGRGHGEFVPPGDSAVISYNRAVVKATVPHVDEVQLDYVRWPDFPVGLSTKKKKALLLSSIRYILQDVPDSMPVSADIFGRIPLQPRGSNDMIAQDIYDFYEIFDILSPMAYPSHYWRELLNPYQAPYHTLLNMISFGSDTSRIRVWIQAFGYRVPKRKGMAWYIRRQLDAVYDVGWPGYMFWLPNVPVLTRTHREYLSSLPSDSGGDVWDVARVYDTAGVLDTLFRKYDVLIKYGGWTLRYWIRSAFPGLKDVKIFRGDSTLLVYTREEWGWTEKPFNVVILLRAGDFRVDERRRNYTLYWRGEPPATVEVIKGNGTLRLRARDSTGNVLSESIAFPL